MMTSRIAPAVACLVAALTIACATTPQAGSTTSPTPSATASPSPTATASPQPSASPSLTPASAYLDDRSSPEQVIRSYYDAIGRRQYIRAYAYWEPSTTLPSFDSFQQGFATTTAVQVELGTVGGSPGAGQLFWSVPAAVFSATTTGAQAFVGCYTVHLARPEIQTAPPFKPMAISAAQVTAVANAAAARTALGGACGALNQNPLPWGAAGAGIDATHYVDDRSAGEEVMRSYYNSVNRKEYSRAYYYWEPGAPGLAAFDPFAAGYANTKSVSLLTKPGLMGVGAGQTYYSVPAVITATNTDGSTTTFSGCYTLHLGSPNIQATPPFQPLAIQSARVSQPPGGSNPNDLLNAACP